MEDKTDEWVGVKCAGPEIGRKQYMEDLSEQGRREEILRGLEEEFKKGLQDVVKARAASISTTERAESILREIHTPPRGSPKWEETRKQLIGNVPLIAVAADNTEVESRVDAFKIHLKEKVGYINVHSDYVLVVTEKGSVKIFRASKEFCLEKQWESCNTLFVFLMKSGHLRPSVVDALTLLLIFMHRKRIHRLESVFQEFLLFTRASSIKKAFFMNKFLCLVNAFGDVQIFDESLRNVPVGSNRKRIISCILRDDSEHPARKNAMVAREVAISLPRITMKVTETMLKLVYARKSVYEEVHFGRIQQIVYTDNKLFLKEEDTLNVIIFS